MENYLHDPTGAHICPVKAICIESSAMNFGGRTLQPEYFSQVRKLADSKNVKMHLDGARSWNAAVSLDMEMKDYVKDFDLINACLSKGMGCPIGSMVVGSAEDIESARIFRKMIGGEMSQSGVVAAAALIALEDW